MGRSSKWLVAAGVLAFLLIVVARLPATIALRWMPPGATVGALGGTLWHGEAQEVRAGGIDIDRIEWRLHPLALVGGELAARLEGEAAADHVTAEISIDRQRRFVATAVEARLDVALLAGRALPSGWAGPLSVHLDELIVERGWIAAIKGTAQSGALTGPPKVQPYLGSYRLEFGDDAAAAPGELLGHFRDSGGPIEISGDVRLYRDRRAVVSGWVRARPVAPPAVVEDIARLPQADPQGRRHFSIENSF